MSSEGNHGEPPDFLKWLLWLFRKETWRSQPVLAAAGLVIVAATAGVSIRGLYRIIYPPERAES